MEDREVDSEEEREEIHYIETQVEMGKVEKLMEKAYVKLLPMAMREVEEGGCRYVVISLSKILTSTSRFWAGDYQGAIRAYTTALECCPAKVSILSCIANCNYKLKKKSEMEIKAGSWR